MAPDSSFLDRSVGDLLEEVAARTPAPGGGSVAALAVAMTAGLAAMAARFADGHWHGARSALAEAESLLERAAPLADRDAEAYAALLAARRAARERAPGAGEAAVGDALAAAADVPLETASLAAETASLAASLVEHGNPSLRGDAATAACLAAAGARAAAALVAINLAGRGEDDRVARARELAGAADEAAARALGFVS